MNMRVRFTYEFYSINNIWGAGNTLFKSFKIKEMYNNLIFSIRPDLLKI